MGANDAAEQLAVAIEEFGRLERELAGALAVIEQVRKVVDGERIPDEVHGDDWILADHFQTILATSPPDALDAVKAAAWDEVAELVEDTDDNTPYPSGYFYAQAIRDRNPYRKGGLA